MADSTTTNLLLTKPEVGASQDSWGTKINTDLDSVDAIFAANGTGTSVGLNIGSGKSLKLVGDVIDTNGNELLKVTGTASAVNEVTLANAATGGTPTFTASGGDTNIGFKLVGKGTGEITARVNGSDVFNASSSFGFKNRIINGAMVIDQRNAGASQTFTAAGALAYAVDRFYGFCTGANVTGAQVAGSGANQFRYRFTGAASVTAVGFGQRIEQKNSYDLAGSTATLSADLAISATLTTVTWTASYATTTADTFGSLASPTVTQIATGTFTVTSTVTNFNAQITVPSAATTGIQIVFTVGALTAGLTWTIGNVQLEKGSTATSFDYRPYGTELALCQRYFQKSYNTTEAVGLATTTGEIRWVAASTAGEAAPTIMLPVTLRVSPTLTLYSPNNSASGFVYNYSTATNTAMTGVNVSGTRGWSGGSTGFTANNIIGYHFTASSEL